MTAPPENRVSGDLDLLIQQTAHLTGLGSVTSRRVLSTGYEDTNLDVTTSGGTHVVIKVFADERNGLAERTAQLILAAQSAGVRHPHLHRDPSGQVVHTIDGHCLIVMDKVAGHTIYDLGQGPDNHQLHDLLTQISRFHAVTLDLPAVSDPWAITNLPALAHRLHGVLEPQQRTLVERAATAAAAIDRAALPHSLIHGDLTQGNVMTGPEGISVLDFAVARRECRVQELAVIAANLTHEDPDPLPARTERIATVFSSVAATPLSTAEQIALQAFAPAAAAMEMLGGIDEFRAGNTGSETRYLIELGRAGLKAWYS